MATKIIKKSLVLLLLIPPLCYSIDPAKDSPRATYTPVQYLKNYALSACLADGLQAKGAQGEASDAARGYLELGEFGIEAYDEAAVLANKFLAKKYIGIKGEKLTVMKCIDLFYSKELDQLAQKYNKERDAAIKKERAKRR